jgi:hypothetical protein
VEFLKKFKGTRSSELRGTAEFEFHSRVDDRSYADSPFVESEDQTTLGLLLPTIVLGP